MAPQTLNTDPDARLLRWGWLAFAAWTVVGGGLLVRSVIAGGEAMTGVAFVSPLWAGWLLWLLWRAAALVRHWTVHQAYGEWHGNYFEFAGQQIRVVFDEDGIFFAAADVFEVFAIDTRTRAPERLRRVVGGDGLIQLPGRKLLFFTEGGLRGWMARRTDRTATKFMTWLDNEVIAPYRVRQRALRGDLDHDTPVR